MKKKREYPLPGGGGGVKILQRIGHALILNENFLSFRNVFCWVVIFNSLRFM